MDRINGADTIDIGGGRRGFRDENLVTGTAGTVVTALHLNSMQEEVLKVITEAGLVPSDADWTQLWQALQILGLDSDARSRRWLAIISMTLTAAPNTPSVGDTYLVPAGATGTWATHVGAIAQWSGSSWSYLTPPDGHGVSLPDGRVFERIGGTYVEKVAIDSQSGKWNFATAGGTANAWTVTLAPVPSALAAGMTVRVKVTTAPTGALTLNANGLGAVNVVKGNGDPITNGYFVANEIVTLTYDGAVWRAENTVRRNGDTIKAPNAATGALSLVGAANAAGGILSVSYSGSAFAAYIAADGMHMDAGTAVERSQYFFGGPGGIRAASYATEDASPVWTTEVFDTASGSGSKGIISLRGGAAGVASFGVTLGGNVVANFTSTSLGLRFGGNQSISLNANSASISCDGTGVGSNAAGFAATRPATTAGSAPYAYIAAGSLRFYVDEGGGLHSTSGSIAVISDSYFKENISDLPTALDHINALRPVTYRLKDDDETRATRVGFIAQEVQQEMPLLVTEDDKINAGGRSALTLNMGDMVPYLVKAVQELSARVTDLEAQLAKN